MGVDIHLYIAKKNKISERIFDGIRDREWFANLTHKGYDDEYEYLPICNGISPLADKGVQSAREKDEEGICWYYDFYYVNVGKFRKWFETYHPEKRASWVTTYDAWRIKNKHFIPYEEAPYPLAHIAQENQEFVEYENSYDLSKRLYELLNKKKVSDKADLTFFFDN